MMSLTDFIFRGNAQSFEEFSEKISSYEKDKKFKNIVVDFIGRLESKTGIAADTFKRNTGNETAMAGKEIDVFFKKLRGDRHKLPFMLNICWFYRWLLTRGGDHFIDDSSIDTVRKFIEIIKIPDYVIKKIKWAMVFGSYAVLNPQDQERVFGQILERYSTDKVVKNFSLVIDNWMVYHILVRFSEFQTIGLYEETLIINYISLVDSHPELETIFGTAIERDLEFLYKRISPKKDNESKKKSKLLKKIKEKTFKPKRFIIDQIENVLKKRYALEKIVETKKFLTLLFPSVVSFVLFFGFWISMSLYKEKGDINEFWTSIAYLILMLFLLLCAYWIWKTIGKFIPKFMLVGFLGWFLIGSAVVTGILVPGALTDDNESSIQIPMSRFTGVNEDEVESTVEFHPETQDFDLRQILDIFLSPSLFKLERLNQGSLINQMDKKKFQEKNDIPALLVNRVFCFIRPICFFLLIVSLMFLYCKVTISRKNAEDGEQKEAWVKYTLYFIFFLMALLFLLTQNYFFILVLLLIIFNLFIIRWEILQRGQNHQINSRSVLFLFLTQVFAMISGEIFFLVFLPIYIFISPLNHILSLFDAVLINWIVLVGSQASVLIGLVTQVVWSGKRLTEKL